MACVAIALSLIGAEPKSISVGNRTAVALPGVHNVFRLSEKLYSGGVPAGDAAFAALKRLGIRTVLSVDGARPDVARAKRFGIRTVHIPFGYDGCPSPIANRIVRAVRDLPGPIFLHCHHGRHRSPTAAAFARIALDGISNESAVREMERAGTGKGYTGLYGDVRRYRAPTAAELDRTPADFLEVAPTPPMMDTMVQIDQRYVGLSRCRENGWKTPPDHPDLKPSHEALQLRELFTELARTPEVRGKPADYRGWMRASERDAAALERALRAKDLARASLLLNRVGVTCGACHARYRNIPQP